MNLSNEYILKGKRIKNRICMPPLVCFGWGSEEGMVSDENVEHYKLRAEGGCGIIIIEATCVTSDGLIYNRQLGLWNDSQIDGFTRLAKVCHDNDVIALVQIHHAGVKTGIDIERISSSDIELNNKTARAATINEIRSLENAYADAAFRAKKAGFDGVELHGAHGYLLSQFVSPEINKRQDEYGGSIENRARFSMNIIRKVIEKCGDDFIIGYRMGGNEPTLKEGIKLAKMFEAAGVDILHVSAGMDGGEKPDLPEEFDFSWIVYMGSQIKKEVTIPVIGVMDIRTPQQAEAIISNDLLDFAAVGRGILSCPDWTDRAIDGRDVVLCYECRSCRWFRSIGKCPGFKQWNEENDGCE